ncbi:MAG: GFA family protein [Phenylobacterium sp.]|uniref:GFA family protein n=1 Tax=Phenylobacterium sp. TaxID=1871053 RepID=UPI001A3689A3|nr:GFA family protein [Phenylobacterium sp.]MBL8770199.1 GFA family protein [Phenylobacterium sp.]
MSRLHGQCHCGAVRVAIEGVAAADLPLRACQCGFCRRHGAISTSHPDAQITFIGGRLHHYRFGHRKSDYMFCAECGCYVGATVIIDGERYAILNVTGVDLQGFDGRTPEPHVFDDETPEERAQRRKARWSPAELTELQPSV